MAAKKRGSEIGKAFATFGNPDDDTPVEQQASTPVEQSTILPVSQYDSMTVHQPTVKPVYQLTSKPALKKYTYYLTEAQDMKLEQIRLARRVRGVNVDKSALVREAIDLLQDSEAPPRPVITPPAPVEQKTPAPVEVEADTPIVPSDLVSLQSFADQHAVNRNEATRLWSSGQIAGHKQQGTGRQIVIMLDAKGLHDFWVQFHDTQGFRACDDCPHGQP